MQLDRLPYPGAARARGFTLIELMIAVAIAVMLIAVALPNYRGYVRKSLRTEAQGYLVSAMARQQQFLVDTRAYATTLTAIDVPLPQRVASAYSFKLETKAGPPQTFTLTAEPLGDQAQEACGTMTINQAGSKTAGKTGCW